MRDAVAARLSRADLLIEAKAEGLDVAANASRAELLAALHDAEEAALKATDTAEEESKQTRYVWTDDRIAILQGHPDWTAEELADELETTPASVAYARRTYGRFAPAGAVGLCVVCDRRPVYVESPEAKRLKLCKGCWLEEQRRRLEEGPEAVRLRQAKKRAKNDGNVEKL